MKGKKAHFGETTKDLAKVDPVSMHNASFAMTARRSRAAQQVAEDILPDKEIARIAGVTRQSLDKWKRSTIFRAEVEKYRDLIRSQFEFYTVANIGSQLARLDKHRHDLLTVIEERRAAALERGDKAAPGETTGHVVRKFKEDGGVVYEADLGLIEALNAIELQALKITGQLTHKATLTIIPKMLVGIDIDAV